MSLRSANIFFDRLTVPALAAALPFLSRKTILHYYEHVTGPASLTLCVLAKIGFCCDFRKVSSYFHDVRDDSGRCLFRSVVKDAFSLSRAIEQKIVKPDRLLRALSKRWSRKKLQLHLFNQIREDVKFECLRIVMTRWILDKQCGGEQGLLLIENTAWFEYLRRYAKDKKLEIKAYPSPMPRALRFLGENYSFIKILRSVMTLLYDACRSAFDGRKPDSILVSSPPRPCGDAAAGCNAAMQYGYRKLSFEPGDRSELFWLLASGLTLDRAVLFAYSSNLNPDPGLAEAFKRGMRVYGPVKGALKWQPGRLFLKSAWDNVGFVLRSANGQGIRAVRRGFFLSFVLLGIQIAYWKHFFESEKIRIKISPSSIGSVAQVLALDELGGISAAYQYSIAVMNSPYSVFSCGETIQFVFSDMFGKLWRRIDAPVDVLVHTGFIDDYAPLALKGKKSEMESLRQDLKKAGADFIICFFDENSKSVWYQHAPDEAACAHYAYMLQWLLDDPTLGVIFKPKQSLTLFQRLAPVKGLIEKAISTGRCRFLTADTLVGSVFPAEAALVSDICIGMLLGATSSLEAVLAGVPAVLFDPEKNDGHPFYLWGRGTVVFDDWIVLRTAIEEYRRYPGSHAHVGDWSANLSRIDPFRDGLAKQRMGGVVREICDAFQKGLDRDQALRAVAAGFCRQWGKQHIETIVIP